MGEGDFTFKPWMLPLVVMALTVPITVGMLTEGPGLGLALGGLAVASLIVIAVRMSPYEPIEVAASEDGCRHVLIVAGEAVDEPGAVEGVLDAIDRADSREPDDVLVLAPAQSSFLDRWATDVRAARREAQRKLVLSVAALAAARLEARGRVGDSDLVQATEDALRSFPADEVILVGGRDSEQLVAELGARLRVPLTRVDPSRDAIASRR